MDKHEFKKISDIRSDAKDFLIGNYGTAIGALLIYLMIALVLYTMAIASMDPTSLVSVIFNRIILFAVEIFFGVFVSGMAYMYLNVVYEQPVMISDLFFGFKQHPDKAILLQLILMLINFATSVPEIIYDLYMGSNASQLVSDALMIAGLVLYVILTLAFSQCFYILHDFPERSVPSIVRTSIGLMKGSKFRLFKMYVSFLPLILLSLLAFFVPLLWLVPYMETSQAVFYQNLIGVRGQDMENQ